MAISLHIGENERKRETLGKGFRSIEAGQDGLCQKGADFVEEMLLTNPDGEGDREPATLFSKVSLDTDEHSYSRRVQHRQLICFHIHERKNNI